MPLLFNTVLEVLASGIRKKNDSTHIGKEEVKLLSFTDKMTLYVENFKELKKNC